MPPKLGLSHTTKLKTTKISIEIKALHAQQMYHCVCDLGQQPRRKTSPGVLQKLSQGTAMKPYWQVLKKSPRYLRKKTVQRQLNNKEFVIEHYTELASQQRTIQIWALCCMLYQQYLKENSQKRNNHDLASRKNKRQALQIEFKINQESN